MCLGTIDQSGSRIVARGYLHTQRGAAGGFRLAKAASEIHIGAIVRLLEARHALVECFQPSGGSCTLLPRCRLKARLSAAREAFLAELDRSTLSDCIYNLTQRRVPHERAPVRMGRVRGVLAAFLLSHSVPVRTPIRRQLAAVLGDRGVRDRLQRRVACRALLAGRRSAARAVCRDLAASAMAAMGAMLAMPFVCLLLAFGVGAPNPLSFGGAAEARFDPDRPGVAAVARHPVLLAIVLWSTAHAVPNGDLAHLSCLACSLVSQPWAWS